MFLGPWKDPRPIICLKIGNKSRSKDVKGLRSSKFKRIQWKRYDEHYRKQQMKIPKTTYTSPILKNKYTCLRSSNKESNERKND